MMGYLTWTLPLVVVGVCCVDHGVYQVAYNVQGQHLITAEIEDRRGQGSCQWESPPKNGFNFRTCPEGLCSDTAGTHKRNGTLRFTRCNPHYVLVEGSERDVCHNGKWTSSGHQCIPCGRSQNTFNPLEDLILIHYGHNSSRGDFPWMAALYTTFDGGKWDQICGGTLISPSLVLTAAHCLVISGANLKAEDLRVGVGKLFSNYYQNEISSVISTVQELVRPERYLGVDHLFELDIALLVLSKSVSTGPYVMPACVDWGASMQPQHDDVGYLAGWGVTEQGTPSATLKWATQKYVQFDQCQRMISQQDKKLITQDKFCVAEVKGGKADKGDSGGGLTMLRDGVHYIYGVLSTKLSKDDQNVRLFTNVLNIGHLDWLRRHWRRLLVKEPVLEVVVKESKSTEMCKKYAKSVYIQLPDHGGFTQFDTCAAVEPLIVNGEDVAPKEYPHMALIGYGQRDNSTWLCGGTLISETFVMSVAHCSDTSKGPAKWVLLGEYNKQSTDDEVKELSAPVQYEIIERFVHPDYKAPSVYNDIALFRLNEEVKFTEYVRPICLHTKYEIPKNYAIATGWGSTDFGGKSSDILQKVNLSVISHAECSIAYKGAIGPKMKDGIRDETMLCAGDAVSGKDTCQGDTGGPLQLRLSDPYCMYSQIGITSFGSACGGSIPGVYMRVSHYVPWIENIVWSSASGNPVAKPAVKETKSKKMCKKYAESVFIKLPDNHGGYTQHDTCFAVQPLIVGGRNAPPKHYPHMALIGYGQRNDTKWMCAGTLISETFVMSVAHCSDTSKGLARWVLLGEYNKRSTDDEDNGISKPERYEIRERIVHPDYKTSSVYNDIALFRLNEEVAFNEYVRPICLHVDHQISWDSATATGWGSTDFGGKDSDVLQEVDLAIRPYNECRDAYKDSIGPRMKDGIRDESLLCAGGDNSGKDTCQGDTGGPLQVRLRDPYCMYSQIGITAFGSGCAGPKPGMYTRVSHYVPWIESIVWPSTPVYALSYPQS